MRSKSWRKWDLDFIAAAACAAAVLLWRDQAAFTAARVLLLFAAGGRKLELPRRRRQPAGKAGRQQGGNRFETCRWNQIGTGHRWDVLLQGRGSAGGSSS